MVLLSFSDPKHVPMILDGRKKQTTRKPRKNPIKLYDRLDIYFRSREKKGTCYNCISKNCSCSNIRGKSPIKNGLQICPLWTNFFGIAEVTRMVLVGKEYGNLFSSWSKESLEEWAVKDGFEDFSEANRWFTHVNGPDWMDMDWDIIFFEGLWSQLYRE